MPTPSTKHSTYSSRSTIQTRLFHTCASPALALPSDRWSQLLMHTVRSLKPPCSTWCILTMCVCVGVGGCVTQVCWSNWEGQGGTLRAQHGAISPAPHHLTNDQSMTSPKANSQCFGLTSTQPHLHIAVLACLLPNGHRQISRRGKVGLADVGCLEGLHMNP